MTATGFDPGRVAWVFDQAALQRLLAVLEEAGEVSYDLETTGLNEFHPQARVVLASFTVWVGPGPLDVDTWLLPLYHPESPWQGRWRAIFRQAVLWLVGRFLMAHNGKFDCRWTDRHGGVDLHRWLGWDTQVSSHLLDENSSTKLKERAPATFGVPPWDEFDLSKPGAALRVPLIDLGMYAARDTYWTWRLAHDHRTRMFTGEVEEPPVDEDEIEAARLGRLAVWCSMPTARTLTAVEQRSMLVDTDWVTTELNENVKRRDELFDDLEQRYPGLPFAAEDVSFAATSNYFQAWWQAAVKAGDLRIAALTPSGKPQWNKAVLVRQARAGSEVAQRLLEYRGHVKKCEYLGSWLGFRGPDGAVHAEYNVGSIVTGRLSSAGPNMQQVTKALRPAFVPREGYVLADIDHSQIELRCAAFIARCEPMIQAFRRKQDLHLYMAGTVNHEQALRAASLQLVQWGLPANRASAEVLRLMPEGGRAVAEEIVGLLARSGDGADQAARGWQRWRSERGGKPLLERRDLATAIQKVPEGSLREMRGYFERWGWPWEWGSDDSGRTSHQPQQIGQQALELDHALSILSSSSASTLQDLTEDDWTFWRQAAKACNFGYLYGQRPLGFREYAENVYGVSFTPQEAEAMYWAFFSTWDGMAQWHARVVARVRQTGQVSSPIGRVRRLPEIWSGNEKWAAYAERAAINSPVQGFASDLMQMGAASIMGMLPGYDPVPDAHVVATVHDSIVVEVPADSWRETIQDCIERMVTIDRVLTRMDCHLDVPLVAEASVGTRWGLSDLGTV